MLNHIIARLLIIAAATAHCGGQAHAAEPSRMSQKLRDEGWIELFDGTTLKGWQPTGAAKWHVDDGAIVTNGDAPGWLMTTAEWGNFQLHVEFHSPADTNSGIFLRTVLEPTDPTRDCYELNIAPPGNSFPTGSLVGRKKVSLTEANPTAADRWHALDVAADGGTFAVRLDGHLILEYDDATPIPRGHIGLQANRGAVAFRNLRIRPTQGR